MPEILNQLGRIENNSDSDSIKKTKSSDSPVQQKQRSLAAAIQCAKNNPGALTDKDVMQLQRSLGNKAVCQLFANSGNVKPPVQMAEDIQEEEEPIQGAMQPVQMAEGHPEEEEEPIQGAFQPIQAKGLNSGGIPEEVQAKMESAFKTDFSDVKVHTNSGKASDVGALAYTQGSDIHFAPGQYNPDSQSGQALLGHELTHVVQQREGRVQPTTQTAGLPVNDDPGLEAEADSLGASAAMFKL